ncbi:MAG: ABC transporter ATP-binding protein [Opitutales bacterium]
MSTPIIQAMGLGKSFGSVVALNGVSFDIFPGQVVGFIGANGAGKTTTMRILATLDTANRGFAKVCGYDCLLQPSEVRRRLGWMPDDYGCYKNTTVMEYLDFFARAYGFKGSERTRRVSNVVDFADLGPLSDRPMTGLSKGQAQRLCLGRTLLHDPEVLILDEPAAGLDPKARIEFKNLVRILSKQGKTLLISSHILSELSEMCDHMLFIDGGRIIKTGTAESIQNDGESETSDFELRFAENSEDAMAFLIQRFPESRQIETLKDGFVLRMPAQGSAQQAAVLSVLVEHGYPVYSFYRKQKKLEDVFVDMLDKK